MWQVETTVEIDSCHWLMLERPGPCAEQHGHRWMVTIKCSADSLTADGMVVDFSQVRDLIRRWDHTTINLMAPFNMINPTSENLAEYWCRVINDHFTGAANRPFCFEVMVEETPGNRAVFRAGRTERIRKIPARAGARRVRV